MSEESEAATIGSTLMAYGAVTWSWVVSLSIVGGAANFFRKLKRGLVRPFNFVEFLGELFVSGFTGVVTFLLCEAAHFNPLLSAALIAISGHMGSRAMFLFERIWAQRMGVEVQAGQATPNARSEDVTEPQ